PAVKEAAILVVFRAFAEGGHVRVKMRAGPPDRGIDDRAGPFRPASRLHYSGADAVLPVAILLVHGAQIGQIAPLVQSAHLVRPGGGGHGSTIMSNDTPSTMH